MTSTATPIEREESLSPSDAGNVGSLERIRWFSTFWVLAMAFHHTDSDPWAVWPTLAFGIPLLAMPTCAPLLALFVVATAAMAARNLPGIANHMAVVLVVGLGFAAAALWALLRGRRSGDREPFAERWFEAARTPIALTLLVVYFFTVFHKLNTAFFDSVNSCAEHLLNQALDLNGFPEMQLAGPVVHAAAVGTVVVETVILVFLAVPRLRRWGLLIGVGFHCVLAPASFYDFATTVFALYLLFVPTRVFATVAPRSEKLRQWTLTFFAGHMLLSLTAAATGTSGTTFGLRWHSLQVLSWYLTVLPFMVVLLRAAFVDTQRWPGWNPKPAVLLIIPLLAFVNGASPYLGLKTAANYSMFSNLHTEGGQTNHLLPIVNAAQVVPYQRELVTVRRIVEPDDISIRMPRWMREEAPQLVPWLELRRVTQLWRDEGAVGDLAVRVEYERGGVTHVVPDAASDPVLGAPMPWWQTKFLSFRAADSRSGTDICRW